MTSELFLLQRDGVSFHLADLTDIPQCKKGISGLCLKMMKTVYFSFFF